MFYLDTVIACFWHAVSKLYLQAVFLCGVVVHGCESPVVTVRMISATFVKAPRSPLRSSVYEPLHDRFIQMKAILRGAVTGH